MKTLFTLFVALSFVAGAISPADAASRKKASPKPETPIDTNDRITALHLTSVTVTIAATHQSKEFKVSPVTKITVNGQPSNLSGLAVGMDVNIAASPSDPTTAVAIDAKTVKK